MRMQRSRLPTVRATLVAYRELAIEPFRDREKPAVLSYIATHYTNPQLDLDEEIAVDRIGPAAHRESRCDRF